MPPKDPELIALRKELEDLIAKCQVIHFDLFDCTYYFLLFIQIVFVLFVFLLFETHDCIKYFNKQHQCTCI